MRTIRYLVRKEFLQIFRNKSLLPIIFAMPVIQLLVLSYAADFEIKNLKIAWIDQDQSTSSRFLRQKIEASHYFILQDQIGDKTLAREALDKDISDLVVIIPDSFEKDLFREGVNEMQILVNAIDGVKAGLGSYYINQVILDFRSELFSDYGLKFQKQSTEPMVIQTTHSFWFNPELNYKTFMVPGILVLLVTMIGSFISSMNIVREKELGTIEQLNVTPLRKYQFILGKLIPLWLIGLFEFTLGLLVAKLVFDIPIIGSIALLYFFTSIYLIMILGLGMFISTITDTQQQAMFVSWFFMVIFILMSGLFTPIENMPPWAQQITLFNPLRYFMEVIRMVMLKGADFFDITKQVAIIGFYAVLINVLAVWRYRKTI